MKPVLYFQHKRWFCGVGKHDLAFGMAETPTKAYANWQAGGWLSIDMHLSKGQR